MVGAYDDGDGSAFVFDTTTGELVVKLSPSDPDLLSDFGAQVDIDDGIAVVGGDDSNGSVFLFDARSGRELAILDAGGEVFTGFGSSVAIDDGVVAVGAIVAETDGIGAGAAFIFRVPEPATALLALGAWSLAALRRRA